MKFSFYLRLIPRTLFFVALLGLFFSLYNVYAADERIESTSIKPHVLSGRQTEAEPEAKPLPEHGIFLGMGEIADGGSTLELSAYFPRFVDAEGNYVTVNLYLMVQLPEGFLYFLKPDGGFSPGVAAWRKAVDYIVDEEVAPALPLLNPVTGEATLPPGNYVFSTLVVDSKTAEDLSDLNWEDSLLDLCFFNLEIAPYWFTS